MYELIETRDVSEIKVVDLIRKAGVSRGGFYKNYYLVTDVLKDDIKEVSDDVKKAIGPYIENNVVSNWEIILTAVYSYRERIPLLIKAGMGMQILEQMKTDATKLSLEEILYGATLYEDNAGAKAAYEKATQLYPKDARAFNNLATLAYANGNYAEAKKWAMSALVIDKNQPEANANMGLLALKDGDMEAAESYIAKAANANGIGEIMGNLHLAQGKYAQAEQDFARVQSNSAALAQILNKDYQAAANTLKAVKNADATTDYLRAILYARTGNTVEAANAMKQAVAKDSSLADYAAKDLELKKVK